MKKTIGIIGGNGKMGHRFAAFFEEYGFNVLVSDKGTKLTNKKIVQESDIVFVSVSISHIEKVLNGVVPLLKKGQTLIEINSIKDNIIPILKRAKCEVLSLHPMCNETQLTAGARILFMPVKGKSAAKTFKKIFEDAGFNLQEIKIEKHDKLMAMVQGLPHFAEISFAHTMKDLGFKTKELMKYASPATDLKLKMVGRILAQSPELYGSMQIQNPRNKKIIKAHLDSINQLYEIIEQGDLKAFEKYFMSAAQFLGKYKDEALAETDHVISTLRQEDLFDEAILPLLKTPSTKHKNTPNKNIALLGPVMTYTDTAADLFLKKSETKKSSFTKQITNKIFKSTIEDVITEVSNGKSKFGMVPVENRLHGTVRETLDGLFTHDIQIIDMVSLPINHCLAILPGVNIKDVKIVMSHTQALSQCKSYLQKHLKGVDLIAVSSSAKAFENVKSKNFRHIAVIGPAPSAKHYGFKIIKENIADDADNITKFAVITKYVKPSSTNYKNPFLKNPKNSSIAFYFSSDKAGSLFTVFETFAKNKVNMTRVESRPYKKDFGNYLFFIDFEGSPSEKKVKDTLSEINSLTAGLKFLGTY
ncbi:MAG: prephenate dehydratase [Candidatus Peregrinibacteria bacterium]|nr:prephenate dehydratase [Candidatus Peregrinibacteria bacterium]MDZ4244814.1 prephenate dehydratase [Candidatus Gracilibacteria bacterium]